MLSDSPYAPDLSLSDRLRLIADEYPEKTLEYTSLTHAADLLEDHPDAGPARKPRSAAGDRPG
jgi:hypothetical protein